jgi:hypothetical protein
MNNKRFDCKCLFKVSQWHYRNNCHLYDLSVQAEIATAASKFPPTAAGGQYQPSFTA